MIGLGLRLVLSGGREAITRLLVLAVAVGLGVGLLLTAVAATNVRCIVSELSKSAHRYDSGQLLVCSVGWNVALSAGEFHKYFWPPR